MITQAQAKQNNIKIIDSSEVLDEYKNTLVEKLKALLPGVINSDNQLDVKALNDVIDLANTTSNNQGYELTFAGKGIAKALADSASDVELKAETAQSKNFDNTDNVVIRGDNLDVLKILQANYHNKIKMIYIDPPYNTKNENFIYKDNFKKTDAQLIEEFSLSENTSDFLHNVYGTRSHSGWLSFIYPRLKLARELLTDDGVIFISIDDNEQANLRIICDEIFGEDNFEATIIPITNPGGRDYKQVAITNEYVLVYSKSDNFELNEIQKDVKFKYKDSLGGYNTRELRNRNPKFHSGNRPNLFYPFFVDPSKNKDGYCNVSITRSDEYCIEVKPYNSEGKESVWRWGVAKADKNIIPSDFDKSQILAKKKKDGNWNVYEKNRRSTTKVKSVWMETEMRTENGTREMRSLFDDAYFDHPKSIGLLGRLLEIGANKTDTILDFFAGSGTTGDAVMQLNAKDGGARKFILVQIDEPIDKTKSAEAHKFCTDNKFQPVISSITIERLNRAGEKIKSEFSPKQEPLFKDKKCPDIGYKVFNTTPKPQVAQQENNNENLFAVENPRANTLDTLANMLCATCKTLDSKIECLIKDKLYQADNEIYLLANVSNDELEKYTDLKINLDGWADIDLQQYLNLGVGQRDNLTVVY
ncbi:site-specific DNA-methyltransferase [Candidatus Spongiihabitans sp.]|uniref:site-specific DNA-methyltransferase n=1 Tax=Candidatus Spongiihabitans sp. TaxID=3101308 RepID=UPI003C7BE73D